MGKRNKSGHRPRIVITSTLLPSRGRPRIWGYGYADLAVLFDMSEPMVRYHVNKRHLDPSSLESIIEFAQQRRAGKKKWRGRN